MGEVEFSKTNLDDRLKFSPKALIETKKNGLSKANNASDNPFFHANANGYRPMQPRGAEGRFGTTSPACFRLNSRLISASSRRPKI